jgi:UDP:flavonoid glycosyltransferase YjiC (YdhE family)
VLVSGVPGLGQLVPVLDLAGALQRAGHEVRVATNKEFHAVIAGAGLRPVSAGMSNVEMREQRSRRWPETDAQPVRVWATRMWAQVMAPSTLEDLLVCMEGWPPDVVLHEEGEYAAPVAAAKAGIPWVTHGWGSPLRSASELAEMGDLAQSDSRSCQIGWARVGLRND